MIDLARIAREALGIAGPAPAGDPAAIRALAVQYRRLSQRIRDERARVAAGCDGMQFDGPAADRFRDRGHALLARLDREAAELAELADFLDRAAGQLASAQHAHGAQLERIRAGLVSQAERAGRAAGD